MLTIIFICVLTFNLIIIGYMVKISNRLNELHNVVTKLSIPNHREYIKFIKLCGGCKYLYHVESNIASTEFYCTHYKQNLSSSKYHNAIQIEGCDNQLL